MEQREREGVRLCYEEAGGSEPSLLFVHGWCCDHTYFALQFEHFQRSHRVIAVDLRGHGQSDKPEQEYTMDGFADDLAWLCEELQIERPVVIGHSMGGVIALLMAARYPQLVRAAVMLDSPVVVRGTATARQPLIQALEGSGYREAAAQFCERFFFTPASDPEMKARIIGAMTSAPQHVMTSAMRNVFATDMSAAAGSCKQPLLFIAALPRDVAALRESAPQLMVGQTVGAGHFNQLEVPDQVNAMLERFLFLSAGSGTA